MQSSAHEANRRVFEDPGVVDYYAGSDGLTPCELQVFDRHVAEGSEILDLGVGAGRTTPYLSARASRYVGVDYVPAMVKACRERFPELSFVEADATDLAEFEDASFDVVVFSFNGIDYVSPAELRARCLDECRRVLRPGGTLILSRHNPRAIVRLPQRGNVRGWAMTPLWTLRRTVRLAIGGARTFWSGEGVIMEPAHGFNAPLVPWRRSKPVPAAPANWPDAGLVTHMATPRRVAAELAGAGLEVVTTVGSDLPRRASQLRTPWYYYAAIKRR